MLWVYVSWFFDQCYADDLVLLSPSIYELQLMVNVCCNELNSLDLLLNLDKSASLRIGKGCNKICRNIQAMESNINWVKEAKYLGLYIRSGKKFTCNFGKHKSKFYSSANCIFTKLGNLNPPVTLHLVHSIALPTLTYDRSTSIDQNSNHFSRTSLVVYVHEGI